MEPASAEGFRGLLLLEPRRCTGSPPEDPHQGRKRHLSCPHAQQYRCCAAENADRTAREPLSGRRHRQCAGGSPSVHGRQGSPDTDQEIIEESKKNGTPDQIRVCRFFFGEGRSATEGIPFSVSEQKIRDKKPSASSCPVIFCAIRRVQISRSSHQLSGFHGQHPRASECGSLSRFCPVCR